jgi:hypothetical protein
MRLSELTLGLLIALLATGPVRAALNEEPPKDEPAQAAQVAPGGVQPLLPKLWQARAPVTWKLDRGGVWASLGHSATVMTIVPDGPPGKAARITMAVWRVEAFDAATKAPAKVAPLAEKVFAAAELAGVKGKVAAHNFYVPGDIFRYCLMTTLRFDLSGGGEARTFATASVRAAVIEFLEDKGTVPTTSKWIEPTNWADASWAKRERLLAPWADGRPVGGRLEGAAATPAFGPAAPRVIDAPEVREPKLGVNPEGEGDVAAELEDKAEK